MILDAVLFATKAHEGQTRKTGGPYIYHPLRVAKLVEHYDDSKTQEKKGINVVAALLHDTIEDTEVTPKDIHNAFGWHVFSIVIELTNVYTKKAYPEFNRENRNRLEHERLAQCYKNVRLIKLCDRLDNVQDLDKMDGGFRNVYARETDHLLHCLAGTHEELENLIRGKIAPWL